MKRGFGIKALVVAGMWCVAMAAAWGQGARAPITTQGAGPFYRVVLPVGLFARAAAVDLREVRVYNAAGQPVPFAWLAEQSTATPDRTPVSHAVPIFPVPAPKITGDDADVVIALRQRADGSLVATAPRGKPGGPGTSAASDWMIDTSQIAGALLQARIQPKAGTTGVFGYRVEASQDMRTWRPVGGDEQLVVLDHGGQRIERLELDLQHVRARFLRLRWLDAAQAPSIDQVVIDSVEEIAAVAPLQWSLPITAHVCTAHFCEYELPRGTPAHSLRIALQQTNSLAAVNVVGLIPPVLAQGDRVPNRNPLYALRQRRPTGVAAASAPVHEVELAQSVVYRLQSPQGEARSADIALDGGVYSGIRIATQGAIAQLGQPAPTLALGTVPAELLFLAQGGGPFSLGWGPTPAVNSAGTRPATTAPVSSAAIELPGAAIPLRTLMPGMREGRGMQTDAAEVALPAVAAAAVAVAPTGVPSAEASSPVPNSSPHLRKWLWLALAAGLLLLGGMAWSLLGDMKKQAPPL